MVDPTFLWISRLDNNTVESIAGLRDGRRKEKSRGTDHDWWKLSERSDETRSGKAGTVLLIESVHVLHPFATRMAKNARDDTTVGVKNRKRASRREIYHSKAEN